MTDPFEQAKRALARHEYQNTVDPFHFGLTDHMYIALRDLYETLKERNDYSQA